MKEAKGSCGNSVGALNTNGKAGAKVSNRAANPAKSSNILGRMNPDRKHSSKKGK